MNLGALSLLGNARLSMARREYFPVNQVIELVKHVAFAGMVIIVKVRK